MPLRDEPQDDAAYFARFWLGEKIGDPEDDDDDGDFDLGGEGHDNPRRNERGKRKWRTGFPGRFPA